MIITFLDKLDSELISGSKKNNLSEYFEFWRTFMLSGEQ